METPPGRGPPASSLARRLVPCAVVVIVLAVVTSPLVALVSSLAALVMVAHARRERAPRAFPVARAFALLTCIAAAYAWLVTQGTFEWRVEELFGGSYDSLTRNLRRGSAEVDPAKIDQEAWRVGGRTFMYFGPLPSLLRMVPDLLVPEMYGLWSRSSVYLATLLNLWAVAAIARRQLAANEWLDDGTRDTLLLATTAAFALGTPLVVIGSLANIYHEAIAWSLCAGLWGQYFALGVLRDDERSPRDLVLLSLAGGCAFLSRVTFGPPLFLLAAILAVRRLLRARREGGLPAELGRVALAAVPALAAVGFHLWYNHARFGGWFQFADFDAYLGARPVGEPLSIRRLPWGLSAYFGIAPDNFSRYAPYLMFWFPRPSPELYNRNETPLISPFLVSPWVLFGLVGGLALIGRRSERRLLALCAAPFLLQTVLILCYYWLGYRFAVEFLPLFVFLHALYLRHVGADRPVAHVVNPRRFVAAAGFSVVATLVSLLHFQYIWWAYPVEYSRRIESVLQAIDRAVGVPPPTYE